MRPFGFLCGGRFLRRTEAGRGGGCLAWFEAMPNLQDFLSVLETAVPSRWAEPWDNAGLQTGCPGQEIRRILISLDPTLEALLYASRVNAQLLFTHHPLIFKPISRLQTDAYPGNVMAEAVRSNIAIVAAHTNLDVAPNGINAILADLLGLRDVEILKPHVDSAGAGLGRIGNLESPAPLSEVAGRVVRVLGTPDLRVVGDRDLWIRRIALVGGAGASLLPLAREKAADLFLTGDVGHHAALEAKMMGIALLDGGHFYLEKTAFHLFARTLDTILKSQGWDVQVVTDGEERDPMWRWDGQ